MTGKRSAHERFPEVIAAAVRVFTQDGYRAARMSDVARAAGLSEAALYRYVDSKEGLFVLAIRHALLLADMPAAEGPGTEFPLKPPSLGPMINQAREFVAAEVPFGSLAAALGGPEPDDPAAELEAVTRELFTLETQTREAADMIERSARELPELADLLNTGLRKPVLAALTDYLGSRAQVGQAADHAGHGRDRAPGPRDADLVRPPPALRPLRRGDPGRAGRRTPRSTRSSTPWFPSSSSEDANDAADRRSGRGRR